MFKLPSTPVLIEFLSADTFLTHTMFRARSWHLHEKGALAFLGAICCSSGAIFWKQVKFQTPDRITRVQRRVLVDELHGSASLSTCMSTASPGPESKRETASLTQPSESNIATSASLAPLCAAARPSLTALSEASVWRILLAQRIHHQEIGNLRLLVSGTRFDRKPLQGCHPMSTFTDAAHTNAGLTDMHNHLAEPRFKTKTAGRPAAQTPPS